MIERANLAASFQGMNELVGFDTIMGMKQRLLTTAQREARYGAAR